MALSRRQLLKLIVLSAAGSGCVDSGTRQSGEQPAAPPVDALPGDSDISRAVSFNVPEGWDYPVDESLLPFGHGVASGDPLSDRVILWTRVSVPDPRGYRVANPQGLRQIRVFWAISEDPEFTRIVQSGAVTTTRDRDWTVKVDAQGLQSATTYYYAFAALGRTSLIGRTRTAPKAGDDISDLRIVNAACSSYWSMDFHPYRFISQRDDIDLFCHAGDYIYEFVDDKGWYRARKDRFDLNDVDFRKWFNRDECARRYALYRSDPDLMRAHQCVPFAIMPDQHDFDNEVDPDTGIEFTQEEAAEVFWLWTPSRPTRPDGGGAFMDSPGPNEQVPAPTGTHALLDYRCLEYGDLCDVILLDIRRFRDAGSATALSTLLGEKQTAWLKQTLMASWSRRQVAFRVLVNQINLSQLGTTEVTPAVRTIFGPDVSGPELYTSGWGGFPEARRELYEFLRQNRIIDNVVLSGDSHGWFANDLIEDPSAPNYVPALDASGPAGQLQTVGVELVPSALGRPGGAEVIAGEIYEQTMNRKVHDDYQNFHSNFVPLGEAAVRGLESAARIANPNLRYFNWRTYGYGLSHFTRESHVFELWEVSYPADDGNERLIQQFDNRVGNPGLLARPALFRKPTSGTDPVDQSRQPPDAGTSAPIGRLRS